MGTFEVVEHTADVALVATGGSLAEALAWVAKGMFSLIADPDRTKAGETVTVSARAADTEGLVVAWLNELLYRYETEGFLPAEFDVSLEGDGASLTARCRGERLDPPSAGRPATAVKAATYHRLRVSRNGDWRIEVVLDV